MSDAQTASIALPATFMQAALRGLRGTCPRCGEVSLFRGWLKPVDTCPACGQDWTYQQADDFPPYVAIIVTGHLMAPLLIFLTLAFDLGPALVAAIIVPTALIMMLAILQPAKGAIIAAQWWHGLNGFRKERPVLAHDADTG